MRKRTAFKSLIPSSAWSPSGPWLLFILCESRGQRATTYRSGVPLDFVPVTGVQSLPLRKPQGARLDVGCKESKFERDLRVASVGGQSKATFRSEGGERRYRLTSLNIC
jgi:hypothetical protein